MEQDPSTAEATLKSRDNFSARFEIEREVERHRSRRYAGCKSADYCAADPSSRSDDGRLSDRLFSRDVDDDLCAIWIAAIGHSRDAIGESVARVWD